MFTIGTVPFLNALPLYRTLEKSGAATIIREVPSRLSGRLAAGECDVALIPVVDHFRGIGERLLSDACIGSTGSVRSVLLFARTPILDIASIAIDTSSHTSVALLRIVLGDGYGVRPNFVEHAPDLTAMLENHDAALLIGDKALEATPLARQRGHEIFDLGSAWTAITKRSFVYAAWFGRAGLAEDQADELAALLTEARNAGTPIIPDLARDVPFPTRLTSEEITDYLTHAIEFHLTPGHRQGMEEFERRCRRLELA